MDNYQAKIIGADEFRRALDRNPKLILSESKKFIQRALSKYKSGIINNPWRIGMSGGGAPVLTGNLRDTHLTELSELEGLIYPDASYAKYIHKNRPWLDYVFENKMPDIEKLEKELGAIIVNDLAK